ncbi:MAG: hypothetical protein ABSB49_06705 [Polyangia bacterium]
MMSRLVKRTGSFGTALVAVAVLLAWVAPNAMGDAESSGKSKVVMKGHPQKEHAPVAVPQVTKQMPAPKAEKAHKAPRVDVAWVPGDYFWAGNDWLWDDGFWLDRPWSDAMWIPGHWVQRWWGWSWISGYWL